MDVRMIVHWVCISTVQFGGMGFWVICNPTQLCVPNRKLSLNFLPFSSFILKKKWKIYDAPLIIFYLYLRLSLFIICCLNIEKVEIQFQPNRREILSILNQNLFCSIEQIPWRIQLKINSSCNYMYRVLFIGLVHVQSFFFINFLDASGLVSLILFTWK